MGALGPTLLSSTAMALKIKDHLVVVNKARDGLKNAAAAPYDASISMLNMPDVKIKNPEAVKAVHLCPEYFRAGALGPDIFPDVIEGQLYTHVNQGREPVSDYEPEDYRCTRKCVESRGDECTTHDANCVLSNVKMENRRVGDWRAIDYGMYQLREALAYSRSTSTADTCSPHFQAVAFAYGYLSHIVTDGFGHSYVSEWARGIFDFLHGGGIYGSASEEIRHMAVDDYMEAHVNASPDDLKVSWPTDFLAKLYTSKITGDEAKGAWGDDAGSFGGPFPKTILKIRDVLTMLKNHDNWVKDIPGMYGDVASALKTIHDLTAVISTFGTGFGDPIKDIEAYFENRETIMNILLQRWPDLSGCIGQNMAQGSALPPGTPLREDRCASIDFESDPAVHNLFLGKLNEAAHYGWDAGPDFNFGSTGWNLFKVAKFLWVIGEKALMSSVLDDVRAHRAAKDAILSLCNEKGIANNSTCTNMCTKATEVCGTVLEDATKVNCGLAGCFTNFFCSCDSFLGAPWCGSFWETAACAPTYWLPQCVSLGCHDGNKWVKDSVCQQAVDAAIPICTFCTANPLCKTIDQLQELDAQVKSLVMNHLMPFIEDSTKDLAIKLLELYAGDRVNFYIKLLHDLKVNMAAAKPAWYINLAFLKEDMTADPEYLNRILQSMLSIEGQLASNAVEVAAAVADTSGRTKDVATALLNNYLVIKNGGDDVRIWEGILTVLYQLVRVRDFDLLMGLEGPAYAWLDLVEFRASHDVYETRFGKFFALMVQLNGLVAVRGATVTALHEDLKLAPEEQGKLATMDVDNYYVYYNSIQLTKLALMGETGIFDLTGGSDKLDDPKSLICKTTPNIICDSVQSLDDPNNWSYRAVDGNQRDWERSVAYWASRDREWKDGKVTQGACILASTDFILADSRDKADRLYSKIFKFPDSCLSPTGMGMDDSSQPWTSDGPATVTPDTTTKTQGDGSIKVEGCGYTPIRSPLFNTTDFGFVGDSMALDIRIPSAQANEWFWGEVKLFVSIPTAGVENAFMGQVGLTGLPTDKWTTVTFEVPALAKAALLGDYPRAQFTIEIQQASCLAPANLDNLRFLPPFTGRTVFHSNGSSGLKVATNPLFSFETLSDWTATGTTLRLEQARKTDRTSSLAVTASSWVTVASRTFATSETPGASNILNVDVWVPARQAGDTSEAWMHANLSCPSANINNQYLGNKGLEKLFYNEFNSVTFPLTAEQKNALSTARNDCSISLAFNATNGRGEFLFDKMGFIP